MPLLPVVLVSVPSAMCLALSPVLLPQCSMPACVTAFHVTCAFDHNLDMRTILADNDEVKFKSFCLEHSTGATKLPEESRTEPDQAQLDLEKVTLRKQKLQQLEEDFYELVKPSEVAENLDLSESLVDFVYQYWKLKRKANSNKPLLTPKTDEVDNLAQQEQDVLYRRLKLFMHLRQDLERVSTASPSVCTHVLQQGCWHPQTALFPLTQFDSPDSFVLPSSFRNIAVLSCVYIITARTLTLME